MRTFCPAPRPSAIPNRARLTLEALDLRLAPSSLTDPPPVYSSDGLLDGGGTWGGAVGGDGANAAPQVVNFMAVEVVAGLWEFTGDVIDEAPAGLTILFGGEPESLQNATTTTNASGHFDVVLALHTDGTDNGLASAKTVDNHGLASNVAVYNIYAG